MVVDALLTLYSDRQHSVGYVKILQIIIFGMMC